MSGPPGEVSGERGGGGHNGQFFCGLVSPWDTKDLVNPNGRKMDKIYYLYPLLNKFRDS